MTILDAELYQQTIAISGRKPGVNEFEALEANDREKDGHCMGRVTSGIKRKHRNIFVLVSSSELLHFLASP